MIIDLIVGFVKSSLGIKSAAAATSSSTILMGSGFVIYGSLFMWIFLITIFIKLGFGAFKGTDAEKMDPVESFKKIINQKQKQQNKNFKPDRI